LKCLDHQINSYTRSDEHTMPAAKRPFNTLKTTTPGPLKFVSHRIEEYARQVTYDPKNDAGKVIYNLTLIHSEDFEYSLKVLKDIYNVGITVSDRVLFVPAGDRVDSFQIPEGFVGICTVCSVTLDALLLKRGVPLNPIGGGLLEIEGHIPRRFTSIIRFDQTTIDPTQVLSSQGTTSIINVMRDGNGTILANMRETHMEAESLVISVLDELTQAGFTGILELGVPNTSLLGIGITSNYQGIAMNGGTNPIAAIHESGRYARTVALKGLIEISSMGTIPDY